MLLPGSMHRGRGPGLRSEGAVNTGLHIHGGVNAHHRAGDAAVFRGPLTPFDSRISTQCSRKQVRRHHPNMAGRDGLNCFGLRRGNVGATERPGDLSVFLI